MSTSAAEDACRVTVTGVTDLPALRAHLTRAAGRFGDGYTSETIDVVLPGLAAAAGVRLVALWNYVDMWGTGGDSRIVGHDGTGWREASDELVRHLHGDSPAVELLSQLEQPGVDVAALMLDGVLSADEVADLQAGTAVGLANIALDAYAGEAPAGA